MVASLNLNGRILDFQSPKVMGILNVTPDSFFENSRFSNIDNILFAAEKMLEEGATILDIGGQSSRPGAERVGEDIEIERVQPAINAIIKRFPDAIISIDTFYASVAKVAVAEGALIVNDISAGDLDVKMLQTISDLKVSFIMMHMQGKPETMQQNPQYDNVVLEVFEYLKQKLFVAQALGIIEITIDPGFGFGKTVDQNFELLKHLEMFKILKQPILVGVSRKSMINKTLNISASEALNGTTALNMAALERGANILRVHDVKEAVQAIKLFKKLN